MRPRRRSSPGLARFVLSVTLIGLWCAVPGTAGTGEATAAADTPIDESADATVARYVAARGGVAAWAAVETLELRGTYATFSQAAPFLLVRKRPDRYRFEYTLLGGATTVARDATGPWWIFPLLQVEKAERVGIEVYVPQVEREASFAPPLIGYPGNGVEIALLGPGDVDGTATIDLRLTFPSGTVETWHLDAETHLETTVEAEVYDYSQALEAMTRRTYYSDFRPVAGGLVLPHHLELEFGARLEEMDVESVKVNVPLDPARFALPPAVNESQK